MSGKRSCSWTGLERGGLILGVFLLLWVCRAAETCQPLNSTQAEEDLGVLRTTIKKPLNNTKPVFINHLNKDVNYGYLGNQCIPNFDLPDGGHTHNTIWRIVCKKPSQIFVVIMGVNIPEGSGGYLQMRKRRFTGVNSKFHGLSLKKNSILVSHVTADESGSGDLPQSDFRLAYFCASSDEFSNKVSIAEQLLLNRAVLDYLQTEPQGMSKVDLILRDSLAAWSDEKVAKGVVERAKAQSAGGPAGWLGMSAVTSFNDVWKGLISKSTSGEERGQIYTTLTGLLKRSSNSGEEYEGLRFSLNHNHRALIKCILNDITCESCDHLAIQALGYFVHIAEYANKFSVEQVAATVNGLCDIISSEASSKSLCTRALWCLANQSFSCTQLTDHVTTIVSIVSQVLVTQKQATPTVETEALNLFIRLDYQCHEEFRKVVVVWYKAVVERILFSKSTKLQKRALMFVCNHADHLKENSDLIQWLCARLKEHTVAVMLNQLSLKGVDYAHILEIWSHFISIIGKALHRHGSFLNEMLRVVETALKHVSVQAQEAAYGAWMKLISNFALDHSVLVSRKRLKLLLMPLLRSAVKKKTESVEEARLRAWWHLIRALGHSRLQHFSQVCVPFLMLCMGLDPKLDISHLSSVIAGCGLPASSTPQQAPGKGTGVQANGTPAQNVGPQKGLVNGTSGARCGSLLNAVLSGGGGLSSVTTPPSLSMLLTGCHAILQFTSSDVETIPHSLIQSEPLTSMTYPEGVVSMEMAQFILVYLDGLVYYLSREDSGVNVDNIIGYLVSMVTLALMSPTRSSSQSPTSESHAHQLLSALLHWLASGEWEGMTTPHTRRNTLSDIASLSPGLLVVGGVWKPLLKLLCQLEGSYGSTRNNNNISEWLVSNWRKIAALPSVTSDPLASLQYLSDWLVDLVCPEEVVMGRPGLANMWVALAHSFSRTVSQTTQIDHHHGTTLDPDFRAALQILKFPFLHLLKWTDKSHVSSILEAWSDAYNTTTHSISLLMGDPNYCAHLVSADLYTAYGRISKHASSISLEHKTQTHKFDLYQNAVASAVATIVAKVTWTALAVTPTSSSEDRSKCVKKLLSLLAWQLARFWDVAEKSPVPLSSLSTPHTIHQVLLTLFKHLPTFDLLVSAIESLSEALATLWKVVLQDHALSGSGSTPTSKLQQQKPSLSELIVSVWSSVTSLLISKAPSPFPPSLLPSLTPLLVSTLTSGNHKLINVTLNFWALTFDPHRQLVYSDRLCSAFLKCFEVTPRPHGLLLPGLKGGVASGASGMKPVTEEPNSMLTEESGSMPDSDATVLSESHAHTDEGIVFPHRSPLKGSPHKRVCSSFLGQGRGGSLSPFKQHQRSPGSKTLDAVLSRLSPSPVGSGADSSKERAVSRKLPLSMEDSYSSYVSIPAATKPRLLTEHQQERQQEQRDLPAMYNNLDSSPDHTSDRTLPPPLQDVSGSEECPIIIAESEDVTPPTSSTGGRSFGLGGVGTGSNPDNVVPDSPSLLESPASSLVTTPKVTPTSSEESTMEISTVQTTPLTLETTPTSMDITPPLPAPGSNARPFVSATGSAVSVGSAVSSVSVPSSGPVQTSLSNLAQSAVSAVSSRGVTIPASAPSTVSAVSSGGVVVPVSAQSVVSSANTTQPAMTKSPSALTTTIRATTAVSKTMATVSMATGTPTTIKAPVIVPVGDVPPQMASHLSTVNHLLKASMLLAQHNQKVLSDHAYTLPGLVATPSGASRGASILLSSLLKSTPRSSAGTTPTSLAGAHAAAILKQAISLQNTQPATSAAGQCTVSSSGQPTTSAAGQRAASSSASHSRQPGGSSTAGQLKTALGRPAQHTEQTVSSSSSKVGQSSGQPVPSTSGQPTISSGQPVSSTSVQHVPASSVPSSGQTEVSSEVAMVSRGRGRPRKPSRRKREAAGELVDDVSPKKRRKKISSSSSSSDSEDKGQSRRGRGRGRGRPRMRSEPVVGGASGKKGIGRLESVDGASVSNAALGMENGISLGSSGGSSFKEPVPASNGSTKLYDSEDPLMELSGRGERLDQGVREGVVNVSEPSTAETAHQDPGKDLVRTPQSHDTSAARQRAGSVSGILKHVSQYDTPTSEVKSSGGRRVQFASKPDYREPEKGEEPVRTPRQGRGTRASLSFSSRRTLQMSPSPKPASRKLPDMSPVYPSLMTNSSPVEHIIPSLSPARKFTNGLVHLVRARNITTIGDLCSLNERQIQSLPIKSPKVLTLRNALKVFEKDTRQKGAGGKRSSLNRTPPSPSIVTTPPLEGDGFLLDSDPAMTTEVVTLTSPDSQEALAASSNVQHDHTYSSQTTPPDAVPSVVASRGAEMLSQELFSGEQMEVTAVVKTGDTTGTDTNTIDTTDQATGKSGDKSDTANTNADTANITKRATRASAERLDDKTDTNTLDAPENASLNTQVPMETSHDNPLPNQHPPPPKEKPNSEAAPPPTTDHTHRSLDREDPSVEELVEMVRSYSRKVSQSDTISSEELLRASRETISLLAAINARHASLSNNPPP